MQKLKIITVGKIKEEFYRKKVEAYSSELRKHYDVSLLELPDESIPQRASASVMDKIKETEGEKILEQIVPGDYVVALCIDGIRMDNRQFMRLFQRAESQGKKSVTFVIGGSLGLHDKVVKRADCKLSFSAMTFPHQLMRVMLLESLVIGDVV